MQTHSENAWKDDIIIYNQSSRENATTQQHIPSNLFNTRKCPLPRALTPSWKTFSAKCSPETTCQLPWSLHIYLNQHSRVIETTRWHWLCLVHFTTLLLWSARCDETPFSIPAFPFFVCSIINRNCKRWSSWETGGTVFENRSTPDPPPRLLDLFLHCRWRRICCF